MLLAACFGIACAAALILAGLYIAIEPLLTRRRIDWDAPATDLDGADEAFLDFQRNMPDHMRGGGL